MRYFSRRETLLFGSGLGLASNIATLPPGSALPLGSTIGLRRGIGVHHLLNWPETIQYRDKLQYKWPPFRGSPYQISDSEIARFRTVGFDFIRLTVDPSIFILLPEELRADLESHANSVVTRLLDAGLNVIFDLHPVGVNPAYSPDKLVDSNHSEVFDSYLDMVKRVSLMLKSFPADRVAFEVYNEPWMADLRSAYRWQSMLEALHRVARQADPVRPIILNGMQWDSIAGLLALDISPFKNSNVLFTFHYYDPHAFTHQGVKGDTQWISGLSWPTKADNVNLVFQEAILKIDNDSTINESGKEKARFDTRNYGLNLSRTLPGLQQVDNDFRRVSRWCRSNGVEPSRVLLGEFGCVSSVGLVSLASDRLAWLSVVRQAAEREQFGWAYWTYKGNGGMEILSPDGTLDGPTMNALGLSIQRPK